MPVLKDEGTVNAKITTPVLLPVLLVLQGLFSKNKTDETTKLYHSFVRLWCG